MKLATGNANLATGSLSKGLILHLPMTTGWLQDATTLSDRSSRHEHAGLHSGDPVTGSEFTTFDGVNDSFVVEDSVANVFSFDGTEDWSISLMLRANPQVARASVIHRRGGQGWVMQLQTAGQIDFFLDTTNGNNTFNSTGTVDDNQWHSITFTWRASENRRLIYIDGEFDSSNVNTFAYDQAGINLVIGGAGPGGTSSEYTGDLRDLRIYSHELTTDEVKLLSEIG